MEIHKYKEHGKIWLSQPKYVENILIRFGMNNVKPINIPLPSHFKLSSSLCPNLIRNKKDYMFRVPYANAVGRVGSLMYAMVCTILYISHVVGFVSRYIVNLGKEH